MKITSSRAAITAAFGVVPLLLAASCGGTSATGARQSLVEIQPSSYVEVAPATTTTTTTTIAAGPGVAGEISQGEQLYTVRQGDSLSKIADLHGITLEQLINYNGFGNAQVLILPGDIIKIPPQSLVPGSGSADSAGGSDSQTGDSGDDAASGNDGECPTTYVIKAGDNTRTGVADQFGITFQEMDAANASTPGYENFVVGTEIIIPCPS